MLRTPTSGRFAVLLALTGATALALLVAAPFAVAQPQGDMAGPPVGGSQASPEDVATIDGIMKAFYESTSGPAGQPRDWERLLSLCSPQTRYVAIRPQDDGSAMLFPMSVADFILHNRNYFEAGGFFEKEIGRRVEKFGHIAHVWSVYESRRQADAPVPYSRGIYSIQLLWNEGQWTILSVFWDHEREDNPIPKDYLGFPEE